jgi:hypothetical protein
MRPYTKLQPWIYWSNPIVCAALRARKTEMHQRISPPHFKKELDKGCTDEPQIDAEFLFQAGRNAIMRMH